jgi:hypothetical protein
MTKLEGTAIEKIVGKIKSNYNCAFCILVPYGFSDYFHLEGHIKRKHPEIGAALLRALPQLEKEKEDMLPNAGTPQQGKRGGSGGSRGGGPGGALPYLNADMLSTQPKEARILMVRNEPAHRFGPSVVLKIVLEGKTMLWTLNISNNPNFAILLHKFGKDENEWVDKRILLLLEQDEFSEQYNIRTQFPAPTKK